MSCRRTWKKDSLSISFSKPIITPYDDHSVKDIEDAMYFYYNIDILHGNKTIFSTYTHDFPKVQHLPFFINEIVNYDMDKMYLLEDYEDNGFIRKIKYHQVKLEDDFGLDIEYFYKIERYDYLVKQSHEDKPKEWSEYALTIGKMEAHREYGGSNREDFGKCIMIKNLTKEELLELKEVANRFCEAAIENYNKHEGDETE